MCGKFAGTPGGSVEKAADIVLSEVGCQKLVKISVLIIKRCANVASGLLNDKTSLSLVIVFYTC